MSNNLLSPSFASSISQLSIVEIPKNVQEALNDPEWKKAVLEEMKCTGKEKDMGSDNLT